jgi:hypothetical protein
MISSLNLDHFYDKQEAETVNVQEQDIQEVPLLFDEENFRGTPTLELA